MKYRVGCIGCFGFGKTLLNGQTIKTKNIVAALTEKLGKENLFLVDTYGGIAAKLRMLMQCCVAELRCRNLIIMPAQNGIRIIAPLLAVLNFFLKRKLHYVVIGGWLVSFLEKYRILAACLRKFDCIYVETTVMQKGLENKGFANVRLMPNFKKLTPLTDGQLICSAGEPYRFCTFSRVMKEKGIGDAVEAVRAVNAQYGRTVCTLDIYGQVDRVQVEWFDALQSTFPDEIRYRGAVDFDQSPQVLKDYFALLFPTKFYTEGIPGTIIDAYAAGVPVVASEWESFADIIDHGSTGIGYPFAAPECLKDVLADLVQNPHRVAQMKKNCLEKAKQYLPDKAMEILFSELI